MDKDNIIWLHHDIFKNSNIDCFEYGYIKNGLKKLGIDKDLKYIIYDNEKMDMKYLDSDIRIVDYDYPQFGARGVRMKTERYIVDGRPLTITRYNHFKKGFKFDSLRFANFIFTIY